MIPWVHLDTASVPGGEGELKLMRRGDEFSIMAGNITLMNSRMSGSEIALAELACDRLRGRRHCRVLIGGYGMGFTLRAALDLLPSSATVVVSELIPAVVEWNRGVLVRSPHGLRRGAARYRQPEPAEPLPGPCGDGSGLVG